MLSSAVHCRTQEASQTLVDQSSVTQVRTKPLEFRYVEEKAASRLSCALSCVAFLQAVI